MNYQKSLKFNILGYLRSVIIFYTIIVLILILGLTGIIATSGGNTRSSFNGMELSTAIFIFVLGLNSFKEKLFMLMQNGVTRKNFFLSSLSSFVILCLSMSVIDRVIALVAKIAVSFSDRVSYESLFEVLYSEKASDMSVLLLNLEEIPFLLCLYLATIAVGFFITISYYRMNKVLKIAISVGTPVGLFVVLPIFDHIVHGRISNFLIRGIDYAMGGSTQNPFRAMVTFFLVFVVFSGLSWLLTRKVTISNN